MKLHIAKLGRYLSRGSLLLAITPDETRPRQLDRIQGYQIDWASYPKIIQAITELVQNRNCATSSSEVAALFKLQELIFDENLADRSEMTYAKNVAIIASSREMIRWHKHSDGELFICRPNESYQQAEMLGFYSRGEILNSIPKILQTFENVDFRRDVNDGVLGQVVTSLLPHNQEWEGKRCTILQISSRNSEDTLKLPDSIRNDLRSKSGQPLAFTMDKRLVSREALEMATTTSDLV